MINVLERGEKLAFVGRSGTGKTTIARLTSYALGCDIFEAGEFMRNRAKARGSQVDTDSQALQLEDDYAVDGEMLALLANPEWTGVFHGRTVRLLAEGLIKENKLKMYKFLMMAVECRPEVRAARGLEKYRRKYNSDATQSDVLQYQAERDHADNKRYLQEFGETHGLRRAGYLTDTRNKFTRGLLLHSDMLRPKQELLTVLFVLRNFKHISDTGFALAFMRGLAYSPKKE